LLLLIINSFFLNYTAYSWIW